MCWLCLYLVQPLTLVGAWTLLIMGVYIVHFLESSGTLKLYQYTDWLASWKRPAEGSCALDSIFKFSIDQFFFLWIFQETWNYVCIFTNSSHWDGWCRLLISFHIGDMDGFILKAGWHGWWWPDNVRNHRKLKFSWNIVIFWIKHYKGAGCSPPCSYCIISLICHCTLYDWLE